MKDTDPNKANTDNRSNQLNPNNPAYDKSRERNDDKDKVDDSIDESYGDDWEFNHD